MLCIVTNLIGWTPHSHQERNRLFSASPPRPGKHQGSAAPTSLGAFGAGCRPRATSLDRSSAFGRPPTVPTTESEVFGLDSLQTLAAPARGGHCARVIANDSSHSDELGRGIRTRVCPQDGRLMNRNSSNLDCNTSNSAGFN